jgi:hypothetical protein
MRSSMAGVNPDASRATVAWAADGDVLGPSGQPCSKLANSAGKAIGGLALKGVLKEGCEWAAPG